MNITTKQQAIDYLDKLVEFSKLSIELEKYSISKSSINDNFMGYYPLVKDEFFITKGIEVLAELSNLDIELSKSANLYMPYQKAITYKGIKIIQLLTMEDYGNEAKQF